MTPASPTHGRDLGVTLLAIGDVHLGIQPGSIPEDITDWDVDPRDLTPEAALGVAVALTFVAAPAPAALTGTSEPRSTAAALAGGARGVSSRSHSSRSLHQSPWLGWAGS